MKERDFGPPTWILTLSLLVVGAVAFYDLGTRNTEAPHQTGTIIMIEPMMVGTEFRENSTDASGIRLCKVATGDGAVVTAVLAASQPFCHGDEVWIEKIQTDKKTVAVVVRRPDNWSRLHRPFLRQTVSGY